MTTNKTMVGIIAVVAVAVVIAFAAIALSQNGGNNGGDAQEENTIPVYLQTMSGVQEFSAPVGKSFYETISVIPGIEIGNTGNIKSISGKTLSEGHTWTIWSHSTLMGILGWNQTTASRSLIANEGTRLVVMDSAIEQDEYGQISYSEPTVDVIYTVHFFIQFREQWDANDVIKSCKTEKERKDGFWVSGQGRTACEALDDVVKKNGWGKLDYGGNTGLISFFGLGDETDDGCWRYWVQYSWIDGKWVYNNLYLYNVDLSDTLYFGLVRQTTGGMDDTGYTPQSTPNDI